MVQCALVFFIQEIWFRIHWIMRIKKLCAQLLCLGPCGLHPFPQGCFSGNEYTIRLLKWKWCKCEAYECLCPQNDYGYNHTNHNNIAFTSDGTNYTWYEWPAVSDTHQDIILSHNRLLIGYNKPCMNYLLFSRYQRITTLFQISWI